MPVHTMVNYDGLKTRRDIFEYLTNYRNRIYPVMRNTSCLVMCYKHKIHNFIDYFINLYQIIRIN